MEVVAKTIDNVHIEYTCPYCNKKHKHGSNGDTKNRVEHRSLTCHCFKAGHPSDVVIHITDETTKIIS
eukprot:SAG11_NODE_1458_length_4874_cov_218.142827_6_plen_68_part_00